LAGVKKSPQDGLQRELVYILLLLLFISIALAGVGFLFIQSLLT